MSTFALMYEPVQEHMGRNPVLGVYTDYYGLDYWPTSFGFRAVLAGILFYLLVLVAFLMYDIKPRKRMLK